MVRKNKFTLNTIYFSTPHNVFLTHNIFIMTAVASATASISADPGRYYIDTPGQVQAFMLANQGKAPPDALYAINVGGNDVVSRV